MIVARGNTGLGPAVTPQTCNPYVAPSEAVACPNGYVRSLDGTVQTTAGQVPTIDPTTKCQTGWTTGQVPRCYSTAVGNACFALSETSCQPDWLGRPMTTCTGFQSTNQDRQFNCNTWCTANPQACDAAKKSFCQNNPTRPECGCINPTYSTLPDGTNYNQYKANMANWVVPNLGQLNQDCWWPACMSLSTSMWRLWSQPRTSCSTDIKICIMNGNNLVVNGSVVTNSVNALNMNCSNDMAQVTQPIATLPVSPSSSSSAAPAPVPPPPSPPTPTPTPSTPTPATGDNDSSVSIPPPTPSSSSDQLPDWGWIVIGLIGGFTVAVAVVVALRLFLKQRGKRKSVTI